MVAAWIKRATSRWSDLNLRQKLSLAFIVMTLAPLFLATSIAEQEAEQTLRRFVFERNKNLAVDLAHDMEQLFMDKIRLLKIMAASSEIKSMNPARQTSALESIVAQYPEFQVAVATDAAGWQIARSDGNPTEPAIRYDDRDYFKEAMRTGSTVISDVLTSKSAGLLGVVVAEPIKNDDKSIQGLLIFNLGMDNLNWLTRHIQLGDRAYVYIVNKNGKVVIHPSQHLMLEMADYSERAPVAQAVKGLTGWAEYDEDGGQRILAGFSHIPSVEWGLVVEQPFKIAMMDVERVRHVNLVVLLVSALLLVMISLIIANTVAYPMAKISKAALSIAEGDLQTRLEVKTQDEIGQLARNFNCMTEQLALRGAALRRSEEQYRSLVDNINIGVYRATLDEGGRFLQMNPAMVHIFGYASVDAMMKSSVVGLYQNADERERFLLDMRREGFVKNRESIMKKQDGVLFWCSRSGVIRRDETGKEWIDGVIEDVDDRKKAEKLLLQAKEDLEIQVAERTRELTALNAELHKLSISDGLTCIGNRRYLDEFLEQEWQRAIRENTPLSLIMLDIDYFKLFNDTYGHIAGDACLKKIAEVLTNTIKRATDFASRYGGEEFTVVLPNTDERGAMTVAEKIRSEVALLAIPHETSPLGGVVTVSVGVATVVPSLGIKESKIIEAADLSLYQAKAAGRNRVVSAEFTV
ncbi:MAG: diguanylate cyclase [Negativicutes bacterium]